MFDSLPGEIATLLAPHTEASPVAIVAQFIVMFGNAVGSGPRFYVSDTLHHTNENLLIAGDTARAGKGSTGDNAKNILRHADPDWVEHRCKSGLSSGEGLIFHVRDRVTKVPTEGRNRGKVVVADEGISDKRLLAFETEATSVLKQTDRKGNTLSNVTRDAWDHRNLSTLTRHNPLVATNPHISIIAHCTVEDLLAHINNTEIANGWANRFLFVKVDRARRLPSPGRADQNAVEALGERVRDALEYARGVDEMRRTPAAERLWCDVYDGLTDDQPGLLGKLTARSAPHVVRLSMLFSLFRRSMQIDDNALRSALAFWDYCFESTRLIFGTRTGNNDADRIKEDLLPGQGISLSDIRDEIFSGHITAARLSNAIELLKKLGEIETRPEKTAGRPSTFVYRFTEIERKKRWKSGKSPEDGSPDGGVKSENSGKSPFADDAREAVG
jgi:hypothetical protein